MITTSEFKKGVHILVDDVPYLIMNVTYQSPTARGADTKVKVKARNVLNDSVHDLSFRGGDKFSQPDLDTRPSTYLYNDADGFHFMDAETFEQFRILTDDLGDQVNFMTDNLEVKALYFNGKIMGIELPNTVDLEVKECDPTMGKGATAKAQTKNAVLETGYNLQVPPYMEMGEKVRVDTRTGEFVRRV